MNTIQLQCFVAVAEHLNFSRASEDLKMTQPAVSHQIRSLEDELEVKLFNRTSKSVTLTQEGILFLTDAQLILKTALSAKERLGRHEHFIPFEIGCHNQPELNLLPPLLRQLSADFPLLRPSIHLVPFSSLLGLVDNKQIHVAFSTKEEKKKTALCFRELCSAPIACVCSPAHPLAQYKTLTKKQLSGNIIVCSPRQISNSVFTMQNMLLVNLSPEQRYFTESVESALTLAKAQIGYTLYPDIVQARDPGLCYIPITDMPRLPFGVYYRHNDTNPILKRFITLCRQNDFTSNPARRNF